MAKREGWQSAGFQNVQRYGTKFKSDNVAINSGSFASTSVHWAKWLYGDTSWIFMILIIYFFVFTFVLHPNSWVNYRIFKMVRVYLIIHNMRMWLDSWNASRGFVLIPLLFGKWLKKCDNNYYFVITFVYILLWFLV